MNIRRDIRFRVYVAFSCICLLGLAILVKAALIQINDGPELRSRAKDMSFRTDTLWAERGNIYTENGTLLCSTIPQFDAHIDFTVIKPDTFFRYVDTLSKCLSALFKNATPIAYREALTEGFNNNARYFELGTNIPYYQYFELRSFPIFKKGQRRGGLIIDTRNKRVNPYDMLALRTVGLYRPGIWKDKKLVKNVIGLEARYDSILSGVNGWCMKQRVAGSKWATVDGSIIEPQNGKDIVTTLDIDIQNVAEHALMDVLKQYKCQFGTCVVMEVATGKIKAMANLGAQPDGSYYEDQNYALTLAEPGSTFKLATLISLLRDGYINVNDNVNCYGGQRQFANRVMHDSHHGLGVMPIKEAFAHSSNVGMATLAYEHYYKQPEKFIQHLKELHLNEKTGIDLLGESKAKMIEPADKRSWNATTLPWLATGYGIMITPLHTCMLYNAVANNGKMMKPYLVSAIREYGKEIKHFEPVVLSENVADSNAIKQLHLCTQEVVISGTGKHIRSPHYGIAGKTGTAQVADKGITYKMGVYQGSFVGYFPTEKPKYTMVVVIRTKPHTSAYYGGTIAAPVFRMVADKIFANGMGSWKGSPVDSLVRVSDKKLVAKSATVQAYSAIMKAMGHNLNTAISKNTIAQLNFDSSRNISYQARTAGKDVVPDVTGMGLKDAVYLLEKTGLYIRIQGKGSIQSQSIAPGTPVVKGQTILLQLS